MKTVCAHVALAVGVLVGTSLNAWSLSLAPPRPLAERVREAEMVFAGTVVDRVEDGDWVRATLRVDKALQGVARKQKIKVIWRKRIGGSLFFDVEDGAKGVALLKDKHEGRYWLRGDRFEPIGKLDEIAGMLARGGDRPADGPPTFAEWLAAGKPLPEDRAFTGGTPWFDESTGKRRSAEEVYRMIYGVPARPGK